MLQEPGNALHALSYASAQRVFVAGIYHAHFADEETEAQSLTDGTKDYS